MAHLKGTFFKKLHRFYSWFLRLVVTKVFVVKYTAPRNHNKILFLFIQMNLIGVI